MTRFRSLRASVLAGSILFACGLAGLTHVGTYTAFRLHLFSGQSTHFGLLFLLATSVVFISLYWFRAALSPFARLQTLLAAIRRGEQKRLIGEYPSEVTPLVDELNALLAQREQAVADALSQAGHLAHALKTPLALLAQQADAAQASGQEAIATELHAQIGRMRQQIDYQIVGARAAAARSTPGLSCSIAASVDGLVRTLSRLYVDRQLEITVSLCPRDAVPVRREDFDEMLGNLLDNACKHAALRITIASSASPSQIAISIDDDGPGFVPQARHFDATTGLGLAIVRQLADRYEGSLHFGPSPANGLRATLILPSKR